MKSRFTIRMFSFWAACMMAITAWGGAAGANVLANYTFTNLSIQSSDTDPLSQAGTFFISEPPGGASGNGGPSPFGNPGPSAEGQSSSNRPSSPQYFGFTISPTNGARLNLQSLTFDFAANYESNFTTGATTTFGMFFYAASDRNGDLYRTRLGSTLQAFDSTDDAEPGAFSSATIDLSAAQFQNITTPIQFRIFYYGNEAGAFAYADVDNVRINGVAAIPAAVDLISLGAKSFSDGMWVEWKTGLETDNLGFWVWRQDRLIGRNGKPGGWSRAYRLNPALIAGAALQNNAITDPSGGFGYGWIDSRPLPRSRQVRYWLQDVDTNGKSTTHGPVRPAPAQGSLSPRQSSPMITQVNQ